MKTLRFVVAAGALALGVAALGACTGNVDEADPPVRALVACDHDAAAGGPLACPAATPPADAGATDDGSSDADGSKPITDGSPLD